MKNVIVTAVLSVSALVCLPSVASSATKGSIVSPAANSTLTGSSATFQWSAGSGVYLSGSGESAFSQVIGTLRTMGKNYVVGRALSRDPRNSNHILAGTSMDKRLD